MQDEGARRGLELVEGYSTLTQLNYYRASLQLTDGYWDYYALPTPPTGIEKAQDLQPDAKSNAEYNVKYIIAPYELVDPTLVLKKKSGEYFVYLNPIVKPRSTGTILHYSSNRIRIDTSGLETSVILSEVYSSGWVGYLNGEEEAWVQETPISLRAVGIKPDTKFVDVVYKPRSYIVGRRITAGTIAAVIIVFLIKRWRG
jgi:hypothetical protein